MLKGRGADFFLLFLNIYWDHITSCFGDLSRVTCLSSPCHHIHIVMSRYCLCGVLKMSLERHNYHRSHLSHVTCHLSPVTCHLSHVTCHISHVTSHMSHVTTFGNIGTWGVKMSLERHNYHRGYLSHVTCHLSHVICHLSHVTCHMSHVKAFGNIGMWGVKNVTGKAQLP